jgi:adenylate cyclase
MTRAQTVAIGLGLLIVAAVTILRAEDPRPLKLLRLAVFDEYQRLAPRPFENMPVRIVDIDEASLNRFGQWPWPRDRMALLVGKLSEMGASAIAFDILFAEPDRMSPRNVVRDVPGVDPKLIARLPDNDEIFAEAITGKPVILGFAISNHGGSRPQVKAGFAYTGESPLTAPPRLESATPLLPELEANAAGIGHISLNPGAASNIVRSMPLFMSDGSQLYPSLAIEALRVAQGASTYVLAAAPDNPGTLTSVKDGEFVFPVSANGELWLYSSPDRRERYVSAKDVLAATPSPETQAAVAGNIVFIGTSAPGLQDIRTTPLGENVPGVSLHAQAVEQILSGHFLSRPDWADGLEILAVVVLGSIVVLLTMLVSPTIALAVGGLAAALALGSSWLAFRYSAMLFDPLPPIAMAIVAQFAMTAFRFLVTDRQRRGIRRAFSHYLSPSLLHRVENAPDALRLGGDERELTIMFVDVRNFTQISENLSPTALVRFLNTLLDALSRHVLVNEGTLDKFIGDSIMAFWNAPLDVKDHETRAVRAALGMRDTLARLNAEDAFGFGAEQQVKIGIGIHTGLACVGNMGAESRFNYSAVGDAVNIAARIESACKTVGVDILVSDRTAASLTKHAIIDAGTLELKGKTGRTKVFAVAGGEEIAGSCQFRELLSVHAQLIEALRTRQPDSHRLVSAAKALQLSPSLEDFYDAISERADSFAASTESIAAKKTLVAQTQ